MKSRIRKLAVAVATIMSVTALIALGATGASASTGVLCTGGAGRACIQVTGSYLYVQQVSGWVWNNTSSSLDNVHAELYYDPSGPQGPTGSGAIPLPGSGDNGDGSCDSYDLPPGHNTPACNGYGYQFEFAVYLCSAAWKYLGGTDYEDLGYKCVYVHS